jgi:ribosomal protein S4
MRKERVTEASTLNTFLIEKKFIVSFAEGRRLVANQAIAIDDVVTDKLNVVVEPGQVVTVGVQHK